MEFKVVKERSGQLAGSILPLSEPMRDLYALGFEASKHTNHRPVTPRTFHIFYCEGSKRKDNITIVFIQSSFAREAIKLYKTLFTNACLIAGHKIHYQSLAFFSCSCAPKC